MSGMQIQVVGISTYNFTADDGRQVSGTKVHVNRPFTRGNSLGNEACSFTVSDAVMKANGNFEIGAVYDVIYDQKGKLYQYRKARAEAAR